MTTKSKSNIEYRMSNVPMNGIPTRVVLLGFPVRHSRSPAMHNAAFAALGMAWEYRLLPVEAERLVDAVAGLRGVGVAGANVTVPHKVAVMALLDDRTHAATFFCGGSRNHAAFIDRFDAVFVLYVDARTLERRLESRPEDEFGGTPEQRAFVLQLHRRGDDVPNGIRIDATRPLAQVVDEILTLAGEKGDGTRGSVRAP